MDWLPYAIRDGVIVVLVISGPLVIAAALIGLVIGVLQAATQVQEQTIGSALKIIGVFMLMIAIGLWMYKYLNQYTTRTISSAFTFIPQQTRKVVPRGASEETYERHGAERAVKPLRLIEPEEIESEIPEGIPPTAPDVLGRPDIPKPPQVTEIQPPPPPEIPKARSLPKLPQEGFQEPIPIEVPTEQEETEGQRINVIPDNNKDELSSKSRLWQRKELFSYILDDGL